jgi:tRNA(Ile)-lysidine synthase
MDWPAVALELAAMFPRERLHPATVAWAEHAPRAQRWRVALSGGADSVTLLLLLWAHWPKRRRWLGALHFDHRLRGAAARADERFCGRLCAALGIGYVSESWQEAHAEASETEARAARMAFFRQHGSVLWLGHQQDDVAETLLMRLARGSGAAGLSAPRPVQRLADGKRIHLRPLLTLTKREIVAALGAAGGEWREDATNTGRRHVRNRMRLDVIPAWSAAGDGRDVLAGAARSRDLLEEDDAALEAWLADLSPFAPSGALRLGRLAGRPRALLRRALQQWLLRLRSAGCIAGKGPSRQTIDALLDDLCAGRRTRHSLGAGGFAVIGARQLVFSLAPARKIVG